MSITAGDAFVIDPLGGTNLHLWIVLVVYTPELSYEEHAIIVSITSMKKGADLTCVLRPTDADAHDFVVHESYAYFGAALEIEVKALSNARTQKRTPASAALLSRLRTGLHKSPHTRRGLKTKVPNS